MLMSQTIRPNLAASSLSSLLYSIIMLPLILNIPYPPLIVFALFLGANLLFNYMRFRKVSRSGYYLEDNILKVDHARVWTTRKYRWLSFLRSDAIAYEQSSLTSGKKGRLGACDFTIKDWAILKATCGE